MSQIQLIFWHFSSQTTECRCVVMARTRYLLLQLVLPPGERVGVREPSSLVDVLSVDVPVVTWTASLRWSVDDSSELGSSTHSSETVSQYVEYVFITARQSIRLSGAMMMLMKGRQFAELIISQLHIRTLQLS